MRLDFTEIFCHVDDFFKELDRNTNFITGNNKPGCKNKLNRSEVITIIVGSGNHLTIALKATT